MKISLYRVLTEVVSKKNNLQRIFLEEETYFKREREEIVYQLFSVASIPGFFASILFEAFCYHCRIKHGGLINDFQNFGGTN